MKINALKILLLNFLITVSAANVYAADVECVCEANLAGKTVKEYGVVAVGPEQGNGCVKFCLKKILDNASALSSETESLCAAGKRGDLMASAKAGTGIVKKERTGISFQSINGKCSWKLPPGMEQPAKSGH